MLNLGELHHKKHGLVLSSVRQNRYVASMLNILITIIAFLNISHGQLHTGDFNESWHCVAFFLTRFPTFWRGDKPQ